MVVKGERGWPDRTIVTPNGRIICIEFKAPGKESNTSSLQDDRIKELRELKVPVLVTSDLEEAKTWVKVQLRKR